MEAVEETGTEVQREAVVETAGSWTCPECKTLNNPRTVDEGASLDHCQECGAEKPAENESDEPAAVAGKPEDVPLTLDVPLPLDGDEDKGDGFERFNANAAMSTVIAKNIEVQVARDTYDRLKKAAAEAKKELDQDEAALGRIIAGFARAREAQNGPQALLPLNGQPAAIDSNCPWERANPGFTCVVCREAKRHKLDPDVNSEVHPEHAGHDEVADRAHEEQVVKPLLPKLKAKGLHVGLLDVTVLDGDELQQLLDWVDQDGVVPPPIVLSSHLADAPGSIVQQCKDCGCTLADATDPDGFYPAGARVGLDCATKISKAVEAAEAPEPARPPKSHAKKNAAKKREPERERKHQVAAGKKKAEPKAKKGRK